MTYPRTVRYSTLVRFIFPVALVSLLVVIFAVVVIDLVFTMSLGLNGRGEPQLMPAATEERIKTLMLAKQVLEANTHQYRADKSREISETTKFLREENDKLNKKVHELLDRRKEMSKAEKNAFENELTVNRKLFDYLVASLRDTPYPGVDDYTRYTVARLGLAPLVGVEPLIPEFGPVINDVLSFKYPISIPPCQDHVITGAGRTVFVAVISTAENSDNRKIIRQKWKSNLEEVHQEGLVIVGGFAFILGLTEDKETQSSIEEEAKTYEDIIQIGIPNLYGNSPLLKRIAVLNWVNNQCGEIDFVVKVDDNVDVNVLNLAQFVHSHHHNSNKSVFGVGKYRLGRPDRGGNFCNVISFSFFDEFELIDFFSILLLANFSKDEKWKMAVEEWPWKQYPPHILGDVLVLITGNSIRPLLAACQTTPIMPVENVYFYGICAEKAGIENHNYTGPIRGYF
ncbi:hypothetical protein DAPPUDRAFT_227874 [Daphnia pulex]|uniref:Hexosyltransferase n=1 Tax=Daphnia pulex TaxID=6669 RepID=E9H9R7_DAPPU|nr:hypothetical protein DAPPUDRAFT_227874 [Daphnia pulex]|eukprot:EFX71448.1 hypothetical protein DAPPUDRAFT_227874 [Daphnia pulex]